MKAVVKREGKLEQNKVIAFNLMLGQCSHHMRSSCEHDPEWDEILRTKDATRLSRLIRQNCHYGTLNRHPALSALVARLKFYLHRQRKGQPVQDYIRELTTLHEVLLGIDRGQGVGSDSANYEAIELMFNRKYGIRPEELELMAEYEQALKKFNDDVMFAIVALRGALPAHYKSLKAELQNQYNLGNNQYPTDIATVNRILQNYVTTKGANSSDKSKDADLEGVSFFQPEPAQVKGTDGKLHVNVKCFQCHRKGTIRVIVQ